MKENIDPITNQGQPQDKNHLQKPELYLSQLTVKNFRILKDATFEFKPGLNVIVGPNNGGKSALIDALRLLFSIGTYEKKEDFIRIKDSDVSRLLGSVETATISFEAVFHGKRDSDIPGILYEIDANETFEEDQEYGIFKLKYEVHFELNSIKNQFTYKSRNIGGGKHFANTVNIESLDYISAIYLEPLRDISSDRRRVGLEVERLLHSYGDHSKLKDIPSKLKEHARKLLEEATNNNRHEYVAGENLARYASAYSLPNDTLHFDPSNLNEGLLQSLGAVFEYGIHGESKLNLSSNGLGINNLIYSSIVLSRTGGELSPSHRFFLIEEPEAHLHPQLQDSFFRELNELKSHQTFVTSHSPTITAKSDIEKVIVMGHPQNDTGGKPSHLSNITDPKDRRYLHKFLDVTRSQLLFANSAIFVEGVTEALLLEKFSDIIGCGLRRNGVEIVILGAKDGFSHFRALVKQSKLPMRCAFITDNDIDPSSLPKSIAELAEKASNVSIAGGSEVKTFSGLGTFEFELLLSAVNNKDMQKTLTDSLEKARNSNKPTNQSFSQDYLDFTNPLLSYKKMKQKNTKDKPPLVDEKDWHGKSRTNSAFLTAKSDYAYYIHESLLGDDSNKNNFTVPKYIQDAIQFVTFSDVQEDAIN